MTPAFIHALLASPALALLARVLLTFPFWSSAIHKTIFYKAGVAEMEFFGFRPGTLYNPLVIFVQAVCSILIIANVWVWLAAGALGFFTFLTMILVQTYWKLPPEARPPVMNTCWEHVGMIGGLVLVSMMAG